MSSLLLHIIAVMADVVSVELRALRVLGIALTVVLVADVVARKAAQR